MRGAKGTRLVFLLALQLIGCGSQRQDVRLSGGEMASIHVPHRDVVPAALVLDDAGPVTVPIGSRIMLVGDSLAAGLSSHMTRRARSSGYSLTSVAESGTTARYWTRRLAKEVDVRRPHLVIISLGTNDALHAGKSDKIDPEWFEDVVNAARSRGAVVVWLLPPMDASVTARIREVHDIIQSLDVDTFQTPNLETFDGIHPTGAGYARWTAAVWLWLETRGTVSARKR